MTRQLLCSLLFQRRPLRTALATALLCFALQFPAMAGEKLSWKNVTSPAEGDMISAIAATDDGDLFAATQSGTVYRSTDKGQSWKFLTSDGSYTFALVAAGTTIYRASQQSLDVSTDKGSTWKSIGGNPVEQSQSVLVSAAGTLFAGSLQSGVFRSDDGGKTWTQSLKGAEIKRLVEAPNGRLFATVTYPADFGSTDIVADSSGIYSSADGGTTWKRAGLLGRLLVTLAVSTDGSLLAGSQEMEGKGRVFRSDDNGTTWNTTTLQDITTSLTPLSNGTIMATAANSGIYQSADTGKTWSSANSGIFDMRIMGMALHPDGHLYAYDVWGALYRSSIPVATGVAPSHQQTSIAVHIAPHPTADEATFTITTAVQEHTRLVLFDGSGRELAVLADEVFAPGTHALHFSARGLACGVYFYRLETPSSALSGSFSVVR